MKATIEEFMDGRTPKETAEDITLMIMLLTADAYSAGYMSGHKDGMTEAVTTITE